MMRNTSRLLICANLFWAIVIFILCAMPQENIPDPSLNIPHLDKVVHFGMFFVMSLLLNYHLENHTVLRLKGIYAIAILVAFAYGGLIEILQYYFFHRGGDLWDLLADILGGVIGCFAYPWVKRVIRFNIVK